MEAIIKGTHWQHVSRFCRFIRLGDQKARLLDTVVAHFPAETPPLSGGASAQLFLGLFLVKKGHSKSPIPVPASCAGLELKISSDLLLNCRFLLNLLPGKYLFLLKPSHALLGTVEAERLCAGVECILEPGGQSWVSIPIQREPGQS